MKTFIEIFAGIGGFRRGLEEHGWQCKGYCEIDKHAVKSYNAIHSVSKDDEWYAPDITKVKATDIPDVSLWAFGFPCQDISVAGRLKGLQGERSGLFYKVMELLNEKKNKPQWLIIENVKNLLSIDNGWGFHSVLSELDNAGYNAEWHTLTSSDFGVPQVRERVFIIGHLRQ